MYHIPNASSVRKGCILYYNVSEKHVAPTYADIVLFYDQFIAY